MATDLAPSNKRITEIPPPSSAEAPAGKRRKAGRPLEMPLRIEELKIRLLEGISVHFLHQYAQSEWGICLAKAKRYVRNAKKLILHDSKPYVKDIFLEHLAIRRQMRSRANRAGDLKLVLEIVKDEAQLLGLYEVKKPAANKTAEQSTLGITVIYGDASPDRLLNPPNAPTDAVTSDSPPDESGGSDCK